MRFVNYCTSTAMINKPSSEELLSWPTNLLRYSSDKNDATNAAESQSLQSVWDTDTRGLPAKN